MTLVKVKAVSITRRDFGSLNANPNKSKEGDRYYNTKLRMEMIYDDHFKKWLSVESPIYSFGRNGTTGAGVYYRGVNGIPGEYIMPYDGTIVGIGFCRNDSDSTIIEINDDVSGNSIAALDIGSFTQGHFVESFKKDFDKGSILRVRNVGPDSTHNLQGWFKVKWLAKDKLCNCDAAVLVKKGCQCGGS